jgi:anti-sigma factor RsiW
MNISERDWEQLNALSDGELDALSVQTLRRRMAESPELKAAFETLESSREAVRRLQQPEFSGALQYRLEALAGPAPIAAPMPARPGLIGVWRQFAASIAATAVIASTVTYMVMAPATATAGIEDLVTSSHRRSLLAATPVDVQTSDRHTVKPWLDARIGISPPAPDLRDKQFPLIGGRVDVIEKQAVPSLVYRHNEHTITLMAIPGAAGSTLPVLVASGGYNVVRWDDNGFDYWAVSDLESQELRDFVADFRDATSARP